MDPKTTSTETAAYLSKYPQSEFTNAVKLLRAQDFSTRKKFTESIPMWEELKSISDAKLPRDQILFERARALYETKSWIKSAEAFSDFVKEFPQHPQSFSARLSKAVALQQVGKNSIEAWEEVRQFATIPSSPHQTALEQIGLLASQKENKDKIHSTFKELIGRYPESEIIPLAFFQLATLAVQEGDKAKANEMPNHGILHPRKEWSISPMI